MAGGIKMNRKGQRTVKKGRTLSAFTIIFITGLFLGCSTIPTQPWTSMGYTQRCQSYVGRDIKILIDAWGHPHRKLTTDDGNKVYVFREVISRYNLDITSYTALVDYPPFIRHPEVNEDVTGGYIAWENCVTYFETNKENKIVKVVWKGDCKAQERE